MVRPKCRARLSGSPRSRINATGVVEPAATALAEFSATTSVLLYRNQSPAKGKIKEISGPAL